MIFYESSAKKNYNVEEAFRELANKAVELQIDPATNQKRTTSIMELEAKKKRKNAKGGGCGC